MVAAKLVTGASPSCASVGLFNFREERNSAMSKILHCWVSLTLEGEPSGARQVGECAEARWVARITNARAAQAHLHEGISIRRGARHLRRAHGRVRRACARRPSFDRRQSATELRGARPGVAPAVAPVHQAERTGARTARLMELATTACSEPRCHISGGRYSSDALYSFSMRLRISIDSISIRP